MRTELNFKTTIRMEVEDEDGNPTGESWEATIDENTPIDPETGVYILEEKDFKEVDEK